MSNIKLTQRSQRIKESPTMAITAAAAALRAAGKDVIGLGAGEPDFHSPQTAKDAGVQAIKDNKTLYTQVDGIPPLKQAIIDKLAQDNKLDYANNQILVSVGAKQALFNLCLAGLEKGDEAIIPAPYWVSYIDMVELAGATPVTISADRSANFKISPAMLKNALTDKTRAFFINSPSNPTGKLYSAAELKALGDVLEEFPQVVIISDEIYEHILWNGEFSNILNVCPQLKDRTVIINGVSKCYAMTGWRIGYAAGPLPLINEMKKIQSQSTSGACSIAQYAALAALQSDNIEIPTMVTEFKQRHDYMAESLAAIDGIEVVPADGTFYLFPWIGGLIEKMDGINDDLTLCSYILDKAEVAVVPGSAFGAPGYMRLSYATSMDNIQESMARISKLFKGT